MRREYTEKENRKHSKKMAILYISLGILGGSAYIIDKYESYLGNDFCMWNKGIVCNNLENKLNEDLD